jgi:F5/8 type C domain/Cellulase (glycosyl hydrolase family 5)
MPLSRLRVLAGASVATLVATAVVALTLPASSQAAPADGTVTVDTARPLQRNILGLGVQWDPADGRTPTYTDAQWNMITGRVDHLQTKLARVMIDSSAYITGATASSFTYNFNSSQMQRLYRILDYAQAHGVKVMFGEWNKPSQANSYDDPRWMKAIADCLNQLHSVKGYSVVQYYNFVNEPNGDWMIPSNQWNQWSPGVQALHRTLNDRGYLSWIKIVGPDSAFADDWVNKTVDNFPQVMGNYEFHVYPLTDGEIRGGGIENQLRVRRDYITAHDPNGANKYLYLGEMGDKVGITDYNVDAQNRVYDYSYGVEMSDIAIQALRGGSAGMIPWDLDDSMHYYSGGNVKRWGFWNTIGGQTVDGVSYPASDTALRPWYYPMSTLSRLFPQGSTTVYAGPSGIDAVRATAAVVPGSGGRNDLSVAVVNRNSAAKTVSVRAPGTGGPVNLVEYLYAQNDRPVDGNGYAVPKTTLTDVDLTAGATVTVPAESVVFLTTLGTSTGTGTPTGTGGPTVTTSPAPSGNLALGRPAYAQSTESAALPASAAVDGDLGTRWSSAWSDPQWFYVDLGATHRVNKVVLRWEAAFAKAYQIQVSTDGTSWRTVWTASPGAGGTETATFAATDARYVKMYGWERGTQYGYSLHEFEVYGE